MILLPDITFSDGTVLSIQEPYLLDGYIVTDIEIGYGWSYNRHVVIKNTDNRFFRINADDLERSFRSAMESFIATYGYEVHVPGYGGVRWNSYDVNVYLRDIERQCNRLTGSNYSLNYLNSIRRELQRQEREYHEPPMLTSSTYGSSSYGYTHSWYDDSERLYSTIGTATIDANSLRGTGFSLSDWNFGVGNPPSIKREGYIHSHSHKPEYIHYCMPNEDKDTTLLLGAEIEVDCGGESEEHAQFVLKIMCGIDKNTGKALEDKMYCMHDGSLSNGIEFATMPCSLEYHKQMPYRKMFEYLDANGYKAHDTATCGLHIHANRSYLGKTELMQQLTISKILYILEKFNDEICVIARRDGRYSQFVGNGKNETSVVELYSKYKNKDKYVALNLKHDNTIEFRCFKGTLKYETYILTLEFVKNIIDYAKSINIEEIELIKWSDLMNTFSNELKTYYNDRLKKKKADIDKPLKSEDYYVEFISSDGGLNRRIIANPFVATNIREGDVVEYRQDRTDSSLRRLLGRLTGDCSCTVSIDLSSGEVRPVEQNVLEELKHKEKQLKKQIKYSNNFMEKKRLEIELKEIQKEIKKEKRQKRLNNNTNR